ncbi:MAG: phage tail protein [Mangrovibacterium sp.]
MNILRGELIIVSVNIDESTVFSKKLMAEHKVEANFYAPAPLGLQLGDHIVWEGTTYSINRTPRIEKINTQTYRYSVELEGPEYGLYNKLFMYDGLSEFDYTGAPVDFLTLIVGQANQIDPGWSVGTVDSADEKIITFSNTTCRQALTQVADEFKMEFDIANKEISLKTSVGTTTVHRFEYGQGKGLYKLTRVQVSDQNIVTRVYGFGGSTNIGSNYRNRAKKLVFESRHLEANTDLYGTIEGVFSDENIYPKRTGMISDVYIEYDGDDNYNPNLSYVEDSGLDFDINDYLVAGQTATIVFKSGDLSGYQFEIWKYDHETKRIYFNVFQESDGYVLPNSLNLPSSGNSYTLINISMPQSYIDNAETKLQAATQEYLDQNCVPQVTYQLDIDPKYVKAQSINLKVGDLVTIYDAALGINEMIRVMEIEYPLVNPNKIKATISDTVLYTTQERVILDAAKTKQNVVKTRRQSIENARRNVAALKTLRDYLLDADNEFDQELITAKRIAAILIESGTSAGNFMLHSPIPTFLENYEGDENAFLAPACILSHLEIGIMIPVGEGEEATEEERFDWTITEGSFDELDPESTYFLYAKCSKSEQTAIWVLTTEVIKSNQEGFYYFPAGTLLPVDNKGIRTFKTGYGKTWINGREVTTGRVQSISGNNYIDLDTDQIKLGGMDVNVSKPNTTTLENVEIKGSLVVGPSGDSFPIGLPRGEYNPDYTYYKGDEVTYNGSSWTYINDVNSDEADAPAPSEGQFWHIKSAKGTDGIDSVLAVIDNNSHTLPATSSGVVTSYAGSNATIKVTEGSTSLIYNNTGTAGTFNVSVSSTAPPASITPGTRTGLETDTCSIGNCSNMSTSTDIVTITYQITVYRLNGTTIYLNLVQTFTKSKQGLPGAGGADGAAGSNARYVVLTAAVNAVNFDTAGNNPSPSSILLTAVAYNLTGTAYYEFFENDSSLGAASTTNTKTLSLTGKTYSDMPRKIEVQVREGSSGGLIVARDQISVIGMKAGQNTVQGILENSSHTVPASFEGVVSSYLGSGTKIQVYEGSTLLTFHTTMDAGRFTVGTPVVNPSGKITVGARSGSGTTICTVADHSAMDAATDLITITYPITARKADGTDVIFNLVQTITKSKQGDDGEDGTDYEFIFTRTTTASQPATPPTSQEDDYVPPGWTDNMQGINSQYICEWVSKRTKTDGVWSAFSTPRLWANYSFDGNDGSDAPYYEYRYAKNGSTLVPPSFTATDLNPAGWTTDLNSIALNPLEYIWKIVAKKSADGSSLLANWTSAGIEKRYSGPSAGPAMVKKGTYSSGTSYSGSSSSIDVVLYNSVFYRARVDAGTFSGVAPTDTSKWNTFGVSADSVATDLLFATLAYIENLGVRFLRTATTGERIFIDGDANAIKMFRSADTSTPTTTLSDAGMRVEFSGYKFLRINESPTSPMLAVRSDDYVPVSISTYGDSPAALQIISNNGSGKAIESYGNHVLTARSGETIQLNGVVRGNLHLNTYITSESNFYIDDDDCYVVANKSTAQNIYLPLNPQIGRNCFVKKWQNNTVTVYGNGNNIRYGSASTAPNHGLSNNDELHFYHYDGAYWEEQIFARG